MPNGVPYGLKCRMLAICELCVNTDKYKHVWRDGVLFRIGEVCFLINSYKQITFVAEYSDGACELWYTLLKRGSVSHRRVNL